MNSSKLLVCPHCGNHTPHTLQFQHACPSPVYGGESGERDESMDLSSLYYLYECATCHDISVYQSFDIDTKEDAPRLVYPSDAELDKSVPRVVAENYSEAKRVQTISPNAFAVLLRRALEAMCDDRGVPPGQLHARLKRLAENGEIPPTLVEITSVLRTLGNSGAHNTKQKVTVPLTWQMEKFFRSLVEYVYVAPARLKEFKESVEKGVEKDSDADEATKV